MAVPILLCPGCSATPWSGALDGSHHATQFWVLINLGLRRLVFFFFFRGLGLRRVAAALGVPAATAAELQQRQRPK